MPVPFRLLKKEFSKVHNEWQWTYELKITFNKCLITKLTVTDHYQLEHKDTINNQLIWNIFCTKLNPETLKPTKYPHRKVFKWEGIYQEGRYRMIFWFKRGTTNHLWVRNCHPQD